MNEYNTIHETVIRDVIDTIKDGVDTADKVTGKNKGYTGSISMASSLTKATSGLTLVFPVLVDNSLPIETASMISKAVEKKAVSMLQIAFSAFNVTNSKDAFEFIKNFHTNIGGGGKISMDEVIDAMDSFVEESTTVTSEERVKYAAVREDLKKFCNFRLGDDISESSVGDYKIVSRGINNTIVHEVKKPTDTNSDEYKINRDNIKDKQFGMDYAFNKSQANKRLKNDDRTYKFNSDKFDYEKNRDKVADDQWKKDFDAKMQRYDSQTSKDNFEMLNKQILDGDIKKANEMMPTMMVINFCTTDTDVNAVVHRQVIIGVKARLISVNPEDVGNKIITKYADGNILLKFIRATTREISFVKDFLFAIDNAKINAVASSKKGSSTYKYLRLLERRALNGKVRKSLKLNNAAKAISTLVLSQELVEKIKISNNIDLERADVIRPIMEKLNLMMFIIADETDEAVKIIMDTGDDNYESISYTHLERDTSSRDLKKTINLMTKVR